MQTLALINKYAHCATRLDTEQQQPPNCTYTIKQNQKPQEVLHFELQLTLSLLIIEWIDSYNLRRFRLV